MAESVQDKALSAGMSALSKEHGEAVGGQRVKMARPDSVAQFRGVRRQPSGRYGARIWDPSRRRMVSLGTFATVEEAANAYQAAFVELRGCTPVSAAKEQKKKAGRSDAWTEFRGVHRTMSGRYGAQIRDSKRKSWLGTFDAAEDAARAYDAAAVRLHGTKAVTNFKQPREDKGTTAETMAVKKEEEESMDLLNDFPEMPALDFTSHSFISDAQLDDLWSNLAPVERQFVDEFLKDTGFSNVAP